jgi:putative hemolysin
VRFEIPQDELAGVPTTGPLLFVSNHPFGLLDAVILSVALPQVRPDLRIVASAMLRDLPMLQGRCIFVDNFGSAGAAAANSAAMRDCLRWLRKGGALLTFPAGEVAHMFKDGVIADPPWNPAVARMAQIAGAAAVPVFFPAPTARPSISPVRSTRCCARRAWRANFSTSADRRWKPTLAAP